VEPLFDAPSLSLSHTNFTKSKEQSLFAEPNPLSSEPTIYQIYSIYNTVIFQLFLLLVRYMYSQLSISRFSFDFFISMSPYFLVPKLNEPVLAKHYPIIKIF